MGAANYHNTGTRNSEFTAALSRRGKVGYAADMPAASLCLSVLESLLMVGLGQPAMPPAPQAFNQEVAEQFASGDGLPRGRVQLLEVAPEGVLRAFADGCWWEVRSQQWTKVPSMSSKTPEEFVFPDDRGAPLSVAVPWRKVRQVLRGRETIWLSTEKAPIQIIRHKVRSLNWPGQTPANQIALAPDGTLWAACPDGLYSLHRNRWTPVRVTDGLGRAWASANVLGVAFDSEDRLWFASRAGVGCRTTQSWRFYEGKDGLPWNDFTGITAGPNGEVWFGTRLGAIRFEDGQWHYRQGPRWLPHDDVRHLVVDQTGAAWFATPETVAVIRRQPMTLAQKAAHYEDDIARWIKRTPYGYVAEAPLAKPGDKSTAKPDDSDNDGLWTAMYGAGECYAVAATSDPQARVRAKQAFEALRFLQKVTQGGSNAPPAGFVARTIRPVEWPDPNVRRLEADRQMRQRDRLWKVYEPRWPLSADGRWYWKSDTSSDELDGHYFFYGLYHDLAADSVEEKERVREVVRDLTDHLLAHGFVLIDHDGQPTRWAVFGPQFLNRDPRWWQERGLNSLSALSYLAVAHHVTGDPKYAAASRELIELHGYAQNAMYPKVQHGPGSGNQSDDEMAFMCFYSLLRCSNDEDLKRRIRESSFRYWANETPELNPFFNFAYAAVCLGHTVSNAFGAYPISPGPGWLEDSMATLCGFPLDRLNWPHRNSHRLDLRLLPSQAAQDLYEPDHVERGCRVDGRVLPVENRHFNHWNTDPWTLDYGGSGNVLASGTVFLLPYYMGLYHGFIAKPN
jgi:hypothetical protein